ncbi:MAG: hypothetical protein HW390_1525 [Candidatus Brocadiaceae bacterium]|nr:hypothetical protein [Candidatus Brocadiaceae bacterium]
MATINKELEAKIRSLPDTEKLKLIDSILIQLDRPDPEIDRIWAEEDRNRWQAYKSGKLETIPREWMISVGCRILSTRLFKITSVQMFPFFALSGYTCLPKGNVSLTRVFCTSRNRNRPSRRTSTTI